MRIILMHCDDRARSQRPGFLVHIACTLFIFFVVAFFAFIWAWNILFGAKEKPLRRSRSAFCNVWDD